MKITLFSQTKTHEFFLPRQVSGSYSFDKDPDEEYKIINIEAENGNWVLHSNESVFVFDGNTPVDKKIIVPNNYYLLQRDRVNYLIFVTESFEKGYSVYLHGNKTNLIIGSDNTCNVSFTCPFVKGRAAEIKQDKNGFILNVLNQTLVYKNKEAVNGSCRVGVGDTINIYGLQIEILKSTFIINNPCESVVINNLNADIAPFTYEAEKYKNIEVKDIDLYDKKDYFSKSPRIRRLVEEKKLKIDAPPKPKDNENVPAILTFGPMLTMAASSGLTMLQTVTKVTSGEASWSDAWPSVATGILMLVSSLMWPIITQIYNKKSEKKERKRITKLYIEYLKKKEAELHKEQVLQKTIWQENLKTTADCLSIIRVKKNNFWCKRCEQSDFLAVRIGIGKVPLSVEINWPEQGFTIEEDHLKDLANKMIENYKYIEECPLEYNFNENFLTAIMGVPAKRYAFVNNILLQLMTYYCYDDLKIVVFTNKENESKWDYIKYGNYCFTNDKSVRFFATDLEEARNLGSYLLPELMYKINVTKSGDKLPPQKPHYLIICDDYSAYKKIDFFKELMESDKNIGYSSIILEDALNKLPSKCINFISLNESSSGILKNSYEKAEMTEFKDEINYDVNMMSVTKELSNIPIEIEGAASSLPDAIEFLEMEKVGKVEQLNILNRWNQNDSTKTLKAEIGVDEEGNYLYLDLHEKFHGPHGLVAGTTGSGKSEFIITYILSLAMNYSPDDVAFILIDYKGGGLAFAFENKLTGVKLPHLAGTITNLDKAEMHRTLVSIDSEVKRRQAEFNKARDLLGESTIDIYKYQGFYHEGKLSEPIPHLFLIADEFAELKSQQPDFMENLISVARIGRSLGVHLILATQKPSGVVDEQIWSNTKFRVCLKVADEGDSNEMIKKPDAAMLKQSGRFYLQVGMDEYFVLGQSGWAGAKYYPSDIVSKQVDKSINFIDNNGQIIKNIQESGGTQKKEAQGEQLAAIMKEIISVAKQTNKSVKRLWLDNVPAIVLPDQIEQKYNIKHIPYKVTATIGEYDAPELQEQGPVIYDLVEQGSTMIFGAEGAEREQLLNAIIYGICKHHTSEEVHIYTVDYGSESLRMFTNLPHVGGMTFNSEFEKYNNLVKMIKKENNARKKLFVDYGGDYKNYIKNSGKKLPLKVIIYNNYDAMVEAMPDLDEELPEILRDSARYGIIYIFTANTPQTVRNKVLQAFPTCMALKLKESFDYEDALNTKVKQVPADIPGRGITVTNEAPHEYQTVSLVEEESQLSKFVIEFVEGLKNSGQPKAPRIPTLPEIVRLEDVSEALTGLNNIPLGVYKGSLEITTIDMVTNIGTLISSNKITNTNIFVKSLFTVLAKLGVATILIDGMKGLGDSKSSVSNYFDDNYDDVFDKIDEFVDKAEESNTKASILIYGVDKMLSKMDDTSKFESLMEKLKRIEKIPVFLIDDGNKLKEYAFEDWYKMFANADGVWIGTGVDNQNALKVNGYNKEYGAEYPNNIAFFVSEGIGKTFKIIDFISKDGDDTNE